MNIRIGYIPYLNMVPFHRGFGPEPVEVDGRRFEFHPMSPRVLGLHAEKGTIDAGALSLVDWLRSSSQFEPLGAYGIGLKSAAQSVLLFSDQPISSLQGVCAVTDETSTSFRLLQILLGVRYGLSGIQFGRIASSMLFDGSSNALLLIGDEALKAKKEGIPGLPLVTDLGVEWFRWQNVPFVFARWAVRQALRQEVKDTIEGFIQKSLKTNKLDEVYSANEQSITRHMTSEEVIRYWNGFSYKLTPAHKRSIAIFSELLERTPREPSPELHPALPMAFAPIKIQGRENA